jgi:hypothetical protein
MPWIEPRGNQHHVSWYQDSARKRGKCYESFATGEQANQCKRLVDALGGDVPDAQRFLREAPAGEKAATSPPVHHGLSSPALALAPAGPRKVVGVSELCDVFLAGKTGPQPRTLKDYRRDLEHFVKVYFGPMPVSGRSTSPGGSAG